MVATDDCEECLRVYCEHGAEPNSRIPVKFDLSALTSEPKSGSDLWKLES